MGLIFVMVSRPTSKDGKKKKGFLPSFLLFDLFYIQCHCYNNVLICKQLPSRFRKVQNGVQSITKFVVVFSFTSIICKYKIVHIHKGGILKNFIIDYFLYYLARITSDRSKRGKIQSNSVPCVTLDKSLRLNFLYGVSRNWSHV